MLFSLLGRQQGDQARHDAKAHDLRNGCFQLVGNQERRGQVDPQGHRTTRKAPVTLACILPPLEALHEEIAEREAAGDPPEKQVEEGFDSAVHHGNLGESLCQDGIKHVARVDESAYLGRRFEVTREAAPLGGNSVFEQVVEERRDDGHNDNQYQVTCIGGDGRVDGSIGEALGAWNKLAGQRERSRKLGTGQGHADRLSLGNGLRVGGDDLRMRDKGPDAVKLKNQ